MSTDRISQLEMRLREVEAQALGHAYLLHQLLQVIKRNGLRDKNGEEVNIDWIFTHASEKAQKSGGDVAVTAAAIDHYRPNRQQWKSA